MPSKTKNHDMSSYSFDDHRIYLSVLCLTLLGGIFLRLPPSLFSNSGPLHALVRLHPQPRWMQMGLVGRDAGLYRDYVNELTEKGVTGYPDITLHYLELRKDAPGAYLPPVRFLFIFVAYLWHMVFRTEAMASLGYVASTFSILTLLLSTLFAWRLKGRLFALGISALVGCAPTQIHMSQHALIDGFFCFWALLCLWTLWENLGHPRCWPWLATYTLALVALVITKENCAFVWVALVAIILANHWLRFGIVTRELVAATVIGPLLGVVILVFLAGGADVLIATYRLLVSKASHMEFAMVTGDGPWYRYLIDLLLVSPVIVLLAIGAVFRLNRRMKPELFLLVFIVASYLIMCNIKYGMNLRYANMWDMPLRVLALSQIAVVASLWRQHKNLLAAVLVLGAAAIELRQYC